MIEEGTKHARNTETDYTTCSDLERFQDFIYRHLRIQNIIRCAQSPINLVVYLKQLNYKKKKKKKKKMQKTKFPELLKDANNDDDNYENISS